MVTIEIVTNSTRVLGIHVTMSCRYCITFKVMLLFSSYCMNYIVQSWLQRYSKTIN